MKLFKFLFLVLSFAQVGAQTIINNSFENWTTKNKSITIPFVGAQNSTFRDPTGWSSTNAFAGTSFYGTKTLIFKDSVNKMHLTSSVKLRTEQTTIFSFPVKMPGILVLANDFLVPVTAAGGLNINNIPGAGMPYTTKAKSFYGYIADSVFGTDSVSCYAVLKNNGAVVATATYKSGATNSSFIRFESDFKYISCKTPDSIYFIFSSSNINNPFATTINAGTTLWVDSLGINAPIGFVPIVPIKARNDSAIIKCNNPINIDVYANDDTCLQTGLVLSIIQQSTEGVAILNGNTIQFTKNGNAKFGFSSVRYKVCNGAMECDSAFIFINNQPRYDAVNDRDTIRCEVSKDIDVRVNDVVCIGLLDSMRVVLQSVKGVASIVNNKLRFVKNTNATPGSTIVRYVICSTSNTECDTANVTLVLVNSKINAKDDTISTNCVDPIQIIILGNDVLACNGNFTNVSFVTFPPKGTATLSLSNRLTFTPALNSSGIIAFKYRVCEDISGLCDTAEIRINLNLGNQLVANDDSIFTSDTMALKIPIGKNDSINNCFTAKQFSMVKNAKYGTATFSGDSIIYKSAASLLSDTLIYKMCGSNGGNIYCDSAMVKITKPNKVGIFSMTSPFEIYPNPFIHQITVIGDQTLSHLLIYNVAGKLLQTIQPSAQEKKHEITVPLEKGIYFLKLTTVSGDTYVEKIVKE